MAVSEPREKESVDARLESEPLRRIFLLATEGGTSFQSLFPYGTYPSDKNDSEYFVTLNRNN